MADFSMDAEQSDRCLFARRLSLLAQIPLAIAIMPILVLWMGVPTFWDDVKHWPSDWCREWRFSSHD